MTEIQNKFVIYNIQKNYKFLCNYLISFQKHINYCYDVNIVSLYDRNLIIGRIYEIIKEINIEYNNLIINKVDNLLEILVNNLDIDLNNDKDDTFNIARNYLKNKFILNYNDELNNFLYPLDFKRFKIFNLSKNYGSNSLYIIIELLLKIKLESIFDYDSLIFLKFLNKIFLPLKFDILNKKFKNMNDLNFNKNLRDEEKIYEDHINQYLKNYNIYIKKINNDELLNRVICIEVKYSDKTIYFEGLILNDHINLYIKTCQISNKFLYFKKRLLESKLEKCKATKKFAKTFLKH